jgi:glyoxylase-like metal-dependent hydrolase (beta-lactamase superfamily II)
MRYTVGMLLRETFAAGPFECNCTILACGDTKDAVVIDPGGETARIAEIVAQYDLTVRAIVHTHAHLDHIYCTRDVKESHGGAICLHRGDAFLYDGIAMQAAMFGWQVRETAPVDRWIADGDRIELGKRELAVIHTPGHTPGSVCFAVEDPDHGQVLFAGDTLFRRSVGRTDLPGGDTATLKRSIQQRLYTRDPDTLVIPGHGATTKIGDEARANPFVRA